ncbi:hypothetical protein D3C85_1088920 [compost metagenome]
MDVQRQLQGVAVYRRGAAQRAHRAAGGVGLDFLEAVLAVQVVLVYRFQPQLADVGGTAVVGGLLLGGEAVLLTRPDAADVAEHVAGQLLVRVVAVQSRLDLDAGEAPQVGRQPRRLDVVHLQPQRHRLEVLRFRQEFLEALQVARRDRHHLAQRLDGGVEVVDLVRGQLQGVGRVVARQLDAVAVDDQAAVGLHRHQRDAVVLGEGGEVLVLEHLQPDEARHQQQQHQHHEQVGDQQPPVQLAFFGVRVFQACGLLHGV